ncbi:uncharacterized protein [Diabrotica undecimpunctata]|uniref:uncharacterized protein isoform X2 n=1 Tax=Diabrotica undecimpunctata TaxID=50387 RepID=UPI003B63BEE1
MMDDHKNSDNDSSEAESENSSSGSDSSGGSSSAFQGAPDILDTPDVLPIVPEKRLFIKLIQSEFPVSDCRQKVNHPDPRKRSFPADLAMKKKKHVMKSVTNQKRRKDEV